MRYRFTIAYEFDALDDLEARKYVKLFNEESGPKPGKLGTPAFKLQELPDGKQPRKVDMLMKQ